MERRRIKIAIWMFNTYLMLLEKWSRLWNRIRYRKLSGRIGGEAYGRLASSSIVDKHSQKVLREIHDLWNQFCPFNTLTGNSGLHNTAVHKMKLMYYVASVRGTGEIPFADADDPIANWVLAAWRDHKAGKCKDGCLPGDPEVIDELYCPFCAINENLGKTIAKTPHEDQIRSDWFPDHVIELKDGWYVWHKPGTSIYYVRYRVDGRCLIVTGDIGEAVYEWNSPISLEWVAGCHLDYFASKCMASEYGRGYKSWDRTKANQFLDQWWEEEIEDKETNEIDSEVEDLYRQLKEHYTRDDWVYFLGEYGEQMFGPDWFEYGDIGDTPDIRCEGHLVGLRMIAERLRDG